MDRRWLVVLLAVLISCAAGYCYITKTNPQSFLPYPYRSPQFLARGVTDGDEASLYEIARRRTKGSEAGYLALYKNAQTGDVAALLGFARMQADPAQAQQFIAAAASNDTVRGHLLMGEFYLTQPPPVQNLTKAFNDLTLAAMKGEPRAQRDLSDMYLGAKGVKSDPVRAYGWRYAVLCIVQPCVLPDSGPVARLVPPKLMPKAKSTAQYYYSQYLDPFIPASQKAMLREQLTAKPGSSSLVNKAIDFLSMKLNRQ
jgi:TPR repeat protein